MAFPRYDSIFILNIVLINFLHKYFVKTQVYGNKNAPSKGISTHCVTGHRKLVATAQRFFPHFFSKLRHQDYRTFADGCAHSI